MSPLRNSVAQCAGAKYKRRSPILLFIHIERTGGSSIWRQLIACSQSQSRLPKGHQIFYDLQAIATERFQQENSRCEKHGTVASAADQAAVFDRLLRRAAKEIPPALGPYLMDHEILIHLHSPTQVFCSAPHRRFLFFTYSGHSFLPFVPRAQPAMCLVTLRDPQRRILSHLAHILKTVRESVNMPVGFAFDTAEPILSMSHNLDAIRTVWAQLPGLVTFQMRQLIALWEAETYAQLHHIMWGADEGWICRKARSLIHSVRRTQLGNVLGFTFLDRDGRLHLSPNAQHILQRFSIREFTLKQHFEGTRTNGQLTSMVAPLGPEVEKTVGNERELIDYLMREF